MNSDRLISIPLSGLQPDPANARKTFYEVRQLSESIRAYGLLQNLVVRKSGPHDGDRPYTIVAGERRYRALLMLEAEREEGEPESEVVCLVIDDEFQWVQMVENLARSELSPWDMGHRFAEFQAAGMTQPQIAARVGISQGRVSICCQLALYLAPATIERLNKHPGKFTMNQLKQLAMLHDLDTGRPEEKKQLARLEQMILAGPKRRGRPPNDGKAKPAKAKTKVYNRFLQLKAGKIVPPHAMPYVHAMVRYLDGSTKEPRWPDEDDL